MQEVESARHFLNLMQPTQCMDGLRSGSDLKFSSEIVLRLGVTVCLNNSVTKFRCIGLATRLDNFENALVRFEKLLRYVSLRRSSNIIFEVFLSKLHCDNPVFDPPHLLVNV